MKLRLKVTLIFGLTLLGLLGALYGVISQRASQDFAQLNERYLQDETARVNQAMQAQLDELQAWSLDWSQWDELYTYAAGQNPSFAEQYLSTADLAVIELNLFLVFDASGRLVFSQALDWVNSTEQPLPAGLAPYLTPEGPWLSRADLAHALGMSEADLVHLRRGVLMHAIGKMSRPNPLLANLDTQTHQHPLENAFKILSAIPYLRPALAIPDSRHERWDGSGYPRGLVADQIPLAARLFAVADMVDELRYRKRLPEGQVRDRLRNLSGAHFDPEIVDAFLKLEIT